MEPHIRHILSELRAKLEALYGERLVRLVLFGSRARGDAEPDSDIDVLVVLRGPVNAVEEIRRTSHVAAALSLRQGVVVSRLFMDQDDYARAEDPLTRNILREGVLV